MSMNLQDFACRVSDIVWGGELGWDQPNGLEALSAAVRKLKADAKADRLAAIEALAYVVFYLSDSVHVLGEPKGIAEEILESLESYGFTVTKLEQ